MSEVAKLEQWQSLANLVILDAGTESTIALKRLFAHPMGQWVTLADLITGLNQLEIAWDNFQKPNLQVVWLEHPTHLEFAVVMFYSDSLFWHTVAICNKQLLERS